ncbi:BTAD domain-containing putative transcriptional regulator [Amycolatopsis suaedae]|uniref:BTAD domain-containing putative transcriptional regulator n=1 Tax=Amycolatopsis suaedae TaxID=2510978 RepID=UPI0013EF2317|nr:BTAD domain-containing putative transcriptional regulator [Amycolatopsis suaedae]
MVEDPKTWGAALRTRRRNAGLTQRDLASLSGVSVRTIRHLEQGLTGKPRQESVRRLVAALDSGGPAPTAPEATLRIDILGPLAVTLDGTPADLGPMKQRSLFALLALRAGQVVTREELVDALWGDRPPASCHNLVHTYVSGLRKALATGHGAAAAISSATGGYLLTADADAIDLGRFDRLATMADRLWQESPEAALDLAERALRCWRGPALADLPPGIRQHPVAQAAGTRRIAVCLAYAETASRLGTPEQAVEYLRALTHEEPFHEGLHARLMLALAGSGQQATALRLFGELRSRLSDELGIAPGQEVRSAHLQIVRDELPAKPVPNSRQPVPAQLPAAVSGFVGRQDSLGTLDALLGGAVSLAVISGTPGVGKTSLAVQWAQHVRGRFPDGQLYVNLRGNASGQPARPLEVLVRFLRALGVAPEHTPGDVDEAAALFRTRLAGRRMLILLDDAAGADQVRPLLPGSPGCLVVVTSRDRLTGLTAKEGASRLCLGVLDETEAELLLGRMIGTDRVHAEAGAVRELARACAYLPLALRIAAANLMSAPHTSVAAYLDELRGAGTLSGLAVQGEDSGDAVLPAFEISYTRLEPPAQRLFRLLGLVPGSDFTAGSAAALTGDPVPVTRQLLRRLTAASLLDEHAAGRYQFHDLLREYAAGLARHAEPAEHRRAAVRGLFDYYLGHAEAASAVLYPFARRTVRPADVEFTTSSAVDWLDRERTNLFAMVSRAAEHDLADHGWKAVDILSRYLYHRGHSAEWLTACRGALAAARTRGDQRAQARMHNVLGLIHYNLSDFRASLSEHATALVLSRFTGDKAMQAGALHNMGRVYSQTGQHKREVDCYQQALSLRQEIGDRVGEVAVRQHLAVTSYTLAEFDTSIRELGRVLEVARAESAADIEQRALHALGMNNWALGRFDEALGFYTRCARIVHRTGNRHGEAPALVCMAETNCDAGRLSTAAEQAREAVRLGRSLGERRHEAGGLEVLAAVEARLGRHDEAIRGYTEVLRLAEEISFDYGQQSVLIGLGAAYRGAGRTEQAVETGAAALEMVRASATLVLEVRALTELARSLLAAGDTAAAERHAEQAVTLARRRGQRFGEAHALHVSGQALRAEGRAEAGARRLDEAHALFAELGTPGAGDRPSLIGRSA